MLARKTLVHFLNTVLGALVGVLALKFIALYMGDALYGQVAYAMGLTGLLYAILQFGLPQAHKKKAAEGIRTADRIATFLWAQLGLMAFYVLVVLGLLAGRILIQGRGFNDTTLLTLVVMGVYWATKYVWRWARITLVAHQEIARDQAADVSDNFVRAGGSALVAASYAAAANNAGPLAGLAGVRWDWLANWGAEALAATYLAGSLVSVALATLFVRRHHEIGSFDLEILRDYWGFSRPLYLVGLVTTVAGKLDRITLGYFWTDATVGIYFGADRVVSIVNTISFSLGALLLPAVSNLSVREEEERIADLTYQAHRYTTMVVLPMVAGLVFFSDAIIALILSDEFLRGAPVLAILAVYTFLKVAVRPYSVVIMGMDMPGLAARVGFAGAVTNIVLNLVLVPADIKSLGLQLFGLKAVGAALATLASAAVTYVLYRHIASKVVDLEPQWHHVLRQLAAALLMGFFLLAVDERVVALERWYHFLLYGVIGTPVYVAGMAALREFTREDLRFFADMVHPREIWGYVRGELFGNGG